MKYIKKLKINIKSKGSVSVEASMIFPLIMFILFGIIYLTIVHYQNNVMTVEAIRAMNRTGAYWQYIDMDGKYWENVGMKKIGEDYETPFPFDKTIPADGIINIKMIEKRNPYRSIVDLIEGIRSNVSGKNMSKKRENAKKYVNSRQANVEFKKYIDKDIEAESINGEGFVFFGDDLEVEVGKQYINPLQGLSDAFFGKNNIFDEKKRKEIKVSSVISNQVEFIRNVDTIFDLATDVYNVFNKDE